MTSSPLPVVLVVEDDDQIRRTLYISLSAAGYGVDTAPDGSTALQAIGRSPDIVLLDLGLPDGDGLDLCREIRKETQTPIIVVSVRAGEQDKIRALDLGADDYVTKPFGMEELLARIRAHLRRVPPEDQVIVTVGPVTLDGERRAVRTGGNEVHLTPTEYDLLRVLMRNRGRVVLHQSLLMEVRGPGYERDTALLRVHIAALRHKLAVPRDTPGYISTEPGVGYRLLDEAES